MSQDMQTTKTVYRILVWLVWHSSLLLGCFAVQRVFHCWDPFRFSRCNESLTQGLIGSASHRSWKRSHWKNWIQTSEQQNQWRFGDHPNQTPGCTGVLFSVSWTWCSVHPKDIPYRFEGLKKEICQPHLIGARCRCHCLSAFLCI